MSWLLNTHQVLLGAYTRMVANPKNNPINCELYKSKVKKNVELGMVKEKSNRVRRGWELG